MIDTNLHDSAPVWRVELDAVLADEWRREMGSDQRAAEIESDWESKFGDPMPVDARLLRVEPDGPVGVFVERSWPTPDYGYRNAMLWRYLRGVVPERKPEGYEGPTLVSHVVYILREAGALTDELRPVEIEYACRAAGSLTNKPT